MGPLCSCAVRRRGSRDTARHGRSPGAWPPERGRCPTRAGRGRLDLVGVHALRRPVWRPRARAASRAALGALQNQSTLILGQAREDPGEELARGGRQVDALGAGAKFDVLGDDPLQQLDHLGEGPAQRSKQRRRGCHPAEHLAEGGEAVAVPLGSRDDIAVDVVGGHPAAVSASICCRPSGDGWRRGRIRRCGRCCLWGMTPYCRKSAHVSIPDRHVSDSLLGHFRRLQGTPGGRGAEVSVNRTTDTPKTSPVIPSSFFLGPAPVLGCPGDARAHRGRRRSGPCVSPGPGAALLVQGAPDADLDQGYGVGGLARESVIPLARRHGVTHGLAQVGVGRGRGSASVVFLEHARQ